MAGRVPGLMPSRLVAHCLLVEGPDGLVLVDTGFGTADVADPAGRLGRTFALATGARMSAADTAIAQVRALGLDPRDVRDIVLTHLDADHAGGISDFPWARVHVHRDELATARGRHGRLGRTRYSVRQWQHDPQWVEHAAGGDDWFGFESVQAVGEDVLLVPLRGHTAGHCGVAVRRPSGGWFLHAGDGYFFRGEKHTPPSSPPGIRVFQTVMEMDRGARLANQDRLRELHAGNGDEVTIFCAHDEVEFDAAVADLEGRTIR
ncbi:MBL fold metallo-hydrolase [Rhodococcus sp. NPDC127528]|uniref:MBL fold metallo-hydrolase n=1 Tax=unclassified Rhodococcus (in: high G+C Gram-positive bacteria) TaxID=192944 RepID=UPI00363E8505